MFTDGISINTVELWLFLESKGVVLLVAAYSNVELTFKPLKGTKSGLLKFNIFIYYLEILFVFLLRIQLGHG